MTSFRPCIDLHRGSVKQIVGGSLTDEGARENYVSPHGAPYYAARYRDDRLRGGHMILLGPGNEEAAAAALAAYPGGLQLGGGVNLTTARKWLDLGASHVIVTSYLFESGRFSWDRLKALLAVVRPEELVIDLSCRKVPGGYRVATNLWQTVTETSVDRELLQRLGDVSSELLVHAADVEGLCQGIDEEVVALLAEHSPLPCTYAGGIRALSDFALIERLSGGRVDFTVGSALDLFGGSGVRYADCLAWNSGTRTFSEGAG